MFLTLRRRFEQGNRLDSDLARKVHISNGADALDSGVWHDG